MVRYACMVLVALAVLNAPYYSMADIMQSKAYNNRWFGGGMKDYNGDFIPSLAGVQAGVFKNSLVGPFIKDYLGVLLIGGSRRGKATKKYPWRPKNSR